MARLGARAGSALRTARVGPRVGEAAEEVGELRALLGGEASQRLLDGLRARAVRARRDRAALVGERDERPTCIGRIGLPTSMPRFHDGLHEPARARLIDAEALADLPDRQRTIRRGEDLQQPQTCDRAPERTARVIAVRTAVPMVRTERTAVRPGVGASERAAVKRMPVLERPLPAAAPEPQPREGGGDAGCGIGRLCHPSKVHDT